MAYALKTTGLATALVSCVLVDEDGVIRDLCGRTIEVHPDVTIHETTWKGVNRKYFRTDRSGHIGEGINFPAPRPLVSATGADGMSAMAILAGLETPSASSATVARVPILRVAGSSSGTGLEAVFVAGEVNEYRFRFRIASGGSQWPPYGDTEVPMDDSTKFSVAGNYHYGQPVNQVFYGAEDGSLAADSAAVTTNEHNGNAEIYYIGGYSGATAYVAMRARVFMALVFNRVLAENEWQSIHDDPWGTLLQSAQPSISISPAAQTAAPGQSRDFVVKRNMPAPSGGITYNVVSSSPSIATVPATVTLLEGQTQVTVTVTAASLGSSTITVTNAADSNETAAATINVSAQAKKLRLLAHSDAAGATAVSGKVFKADHTYVGRFTGAAFGADLVSGEAELKVDVDAFGGGTLTTSDTLLVSWSGTSDPLSLIGDEVPIGSVGEGQAATVIEE